MMDALLEVNVTVASTVNYQGIIGPTLRMAALVLAVPVTVPTKMRNNW